MNIRILRRILVACCFISPVLSQNYTATAGSFTPDPTTGGSPLVTTPVYAGSFGTLGKFVFDGYYTTTSGATNGNSLSLDLSKGFPRFYLTNLEGTYYQMLDLSGKTITFDIDLSNVPCGYNFAVYLSAMDPNAKPGENYCDAPKADNAVAHCEEMDIIEANQVRSQIAPHTCPTASCEESDPQKFAFADAKLDVTKPITVKTSFTDTITQTFTQGSVTKTITVPKSQPMLTAMKQKKMVLVVSLWTGGDKDGMKWLDDGCSTWYGKMTNKVKATVSNLNIGGSVESQPIKKNCRLADSLL